MLSVRGICENGQVRLLEAIPYPKQAKVIVTVIEEIEKTEFKKEKCDMNAFRNLVGIMDIREDGSVAHDQYLASGDRQ